MSSLDIRSRGAETSEHPVSPMSEPLHRTAKLSDGTSLLQQSLGTRLQPAKSVNNTAT